MAIANKKQVDWEAISREYRAGVRSLRDIGAEFNVSEGAIRKRAKAEEWPRDLSEQIKAKTQDLVRKARVRSGTQGIKESETVAANAEAAASVLIKQQERISRHLALSESLIAELESQTINKELYEKLGEMMESPDDKGKDALYELYKKVISTPSRIDSHKKAVETEARLIGLERQAFNLDSDKPMDTGLSRESVATLRRIKAKLMDDELNNAQ